MKNEPTVPVRKRKALLLLPVLILPFLTLGFWALGGGSGNTQKIQAPSGLNLELPDASLKSDAAENKMRFYEAAERDSAKRSAQLKNDPLYQLSFAPENTGITNKHGALSYNPAPPEEPVAADAHEEKVYRKLAELNQQLYKATPQTSEYAPAQKPGVGQADEMPIATGGVDELQSPLSRKQDKEVNDPELQQLSSMMDKILDIQHPERVAKKTGEQATPSNNSVLAVQREEGARNASLLDPTGVAPDTDTGFFGLSNEAVRQEHNAIKAVVHQTQVVTDGSLIKLRLLDDISVNGTWVPKKHFVFGAVVLDGERMQISISSIRYNNSLFPVKLGVYDLDGQPGLYVPEGVAHTAPKQAADNSLGMLNLATMDPSLKVQAATTGLNAVKSLLTRKAKAVKITVKAGYKVFLK